MAVGPETLRGPLPLAPSFQDVVGFAQVFQVDGFDFAVDALGLHDVPVGMAVDDFGLEVGYLGPTLHYVVIIVKPFMQYIGPFAIVGVF